MDEPVGQTGGTPTVVNKRKYVPLPSSGSSSTLSSPSLEADREASTPGERSMLRLPRRVPMAKRPRLDLALSGGGGVTSSSVRTLAPPPVFVRRPPTPFNRLSGETGDRAEGSGYVEGSGNDEVEAGGNFSTTSSDLSSDDSFGDWRSSRQR